MLSGQSQVSLPSRPLSGRQSPAELMFEYSSSGLPSCESTARRCPNRPSRILFNKLLKGSASLKETPVEEFYQQQLSLTPCRLLKMLFLASEAPLLLKTIITMPKSNYCVFVLPSGRLFAQCALLINWWSEAETVFE